MPPSPSFGLFTIVWRQTLSQLCSLASHISFVFFSYCVPVYPHWVCPTTTPFSTPKHLLAISNGPRIGHPAIFNCCLVEPLSFYISVRHATYDGIIILAAAHTHTHTHYLCMFDMVICIERSPFDSTTYLTFSNAKGPSILHHSKTKRIVHWRCANGVEWCVCEQCNGDNPNTAEVKERSCCHLSTPFLIHFPLTLFYFLHAQ